jgi:hypothetical protein
MSKSKQRTQGRVARPARRPTSVRTAIILIDGPSRNELCNDHDDERYEGYQDDRARAELKAVEVIGAHCHLYELQRPLEKHRPVHAIAWGGEIGVTVGG